MEVRYLWNKRRIGVIFSKERKTCHFQNLKLKYFVYMCWGHILKFMLCNLSHAFIYRSVFNGISSLIHSLIEWNTDFLSPKLLVKWLYNKFLLVQYCHTPIFDLRSYIHIPSDTECYLTFQNKNLTERYFKIPHFCSDSDPLLSLSLFFLFTFIF